MPYSKIQTSKLKLGAEQTIPMPQENTEAASDPRSRAWAPHHHQPAPGLSLVRNLVSSGTPCLFWHYFLQACKVSLVLSLPLPFKEDQSLLPIKSFLLGACLAIVWQGWTSLDCFVQLLPLGPWHPPEQYIY